MLKNFLLITQFLLAGAEIWNYILTSHSFGKYPFWDAILNSCRSSETANDCGNLEMFCCISKLVQAMCFFIITRNSLFDFVINQIRTIQKKKRQDKTKSSSQTHKKQYKFYYNLIFVRCDHIKYSTSRYDKCTLYFNVSNHFNALKLCWSWQASRLY